jgi:hypothetical protein
VPIAVRTGSAKTTDRCDVMTNLLRIRSICSGSQLKAKWLSLRPIQKSDCDPGGPH